MDQIQRVMEYLEDTDQRTKAIMYRQKHHHDSIRIGAGLPTSRPQAPKDQ